MVKIEHKNLRVGRRFLLVSVGLCPIFFIPFVAYGIDFFLCGIAYALFI